MPDANAPESCAWLAEEWARQLTHVMESMTGELPYVTYQHHPLSAADVESGAQGLLWWEQRFSLSSDALVWVGAGPKSWEEIGNRVLRSAGIEDSDRDSIRSTYLEIVNQALSGLAGTLSNRAGREISCQEGRESAPPLESSGYSFEISIGELAFPVFAAFASSVADVTVAAAPPEETTVPDPQPVPQKPQPHKSSAIELLLDVELPVSVSFGRAQLPLKDVIKLTTGSIVELNRAVSEPVEVIVNNCVIARGEVVVVEGNFGIRIKQVVSRQERLRTLY